MEPAGRILVASGNMVGVNSTVRTLQSANYEVYTAFDGTEFMNTLESLNFEFNVVVTDVVLPGLEGYDLGDYLALKSGGALPLIGVAELPRDEEFLINASESFSIILEKGYSSEELIEAVDSLVFNEYEEPGAALSEEQRRQRAAELSDTRTVPLDTSEFSSIAKDFMRNKGHSDLMDHFKDK